MMGDFRRMASVVYSAPVLVTTAVAMRIIGIHSGNEYNLTSGSEEALLPNIRCLAKAFDLERLPHFDTIKHFLEHVAPSCLKGVLSGCVRHLIRCKCLDWMRCDRRLTGGKPCFLVALDAVHYFTSHAELPHSTHKTHGNGLVDYMLIALQLSLVCPQGVRIPLMVEFIENPDGEYDKQDCEIKAAKRLLKRFKEEFPHLGCVLLMDGLYLCEGILRMCEKYGWRYSVSLTEHAAALMRKCDEKMEKIGYSFKGEEPGTSVTRTVNWCNAVKHRLGETEFRFNAVRMRVPDDKGGFSTLYYVSSLVMHPVKNMAVRTLDEICRVRWQIESAFDVLKNHGLGLEKVIGTRGHTGQNFYLIVLLADLIRTLMMRTTLFRRLQRKENPGLPDETARLPMMGWYGTINRLVDRLRRCFLMKVMSDYDVSGWRIAMDTA